MRSIHPLLLAACFALFQLPAEAADFVKAADFKLAPGLVLTVKASRFNAGKHLVARNHGTVTIDGHPAWGVHGELPKTQLDEAYVTIQGKKISLDTSTLFNPWLGTPTKDQFIVAWSAKDHQPANLQEITGVFSDGDGAYSAEWKIEDGKARRVAVESAD